MQLYNTVRARLENANANHILHALLPDRRPKLDYELRPRCHDHELAHKLSCLTESNFLMAALQKLLLTVPSFHFIIPFYALYSLH